MDASQMAKFQLQMRENQEELNDFVSGLGSWASEMKEKEQQMKKSQPKVERSGDPPIRNSLLKKKKKKVKKPPTSDSAPIKKSKDKKINAYDYRAWDKFDVDAACAQVDDAKSKSEEEEEETDEEWEEERRQLLAKQEKEKGNAHFKAGRWDDAVECYTTASRLDPGNPLLFTNRAMAQIKAERFAAAEADCSEALRLEASCAKALYRRGIARKALGAHRAADALADFEALLELEPQNKAAMAEAKALEKIVRPTGEVKAVHKAPSQRSKKPLRRIAIEQVGDQTDREVRKAPPELDNFLRSRAEEQQEAERVKEQQQEKQEPAPGPAPPKETQMEVSEPQKNQKQQKEEEEEPIPRSFTQFARSYQALRFRSEAHLLAFLRRIPAASYPALFGQCLEPPHLCALLRALAEADGPQAVAGLRALRATPRFGFLAMMVGAAEKTALRGLRQRLVAAGEVSEEEAQHLMADFRL